VLKEAGVCLVGGHTVEDDELKYGLSVTGLIDPDRIIRNSAARPGDVLILTKPLGTGIISTAIKGDMADDECMAEAVAWMTTLNRTAADLMLECNASSATDVTGFGLIGHAAEMARGAGVSIRLDFGAIPLMSGVAALVADGMAPAGCYRNRDYYSSMLDKAVSEECLPLFDPQTSGGMLIALSPDDAVRFTAEAKKMQLFTAVIGKVLPPGLHPILIG
jgi:selenide,water dikinase